MLRSKTNSQNSLRPVSMSGLPQSNPKNRYLTETCQLSVSESALNQISQEQVSVNGRDSSTIEESTATQTQDCCGSFNTNSLRRRKLKHKRKSTLVSSVFFYLLNQIFQHGLLINDFKCFFVMNSGEKE